jgi:hypothetical protein
MQVVRNPDVFFGHGVPLLNIKGAYRICNLVCKRRSSVALPESRQRQEEPPLFPISVDEVRVDAEK